MKRRNLKRAISILCLAAVTAGVTLAASWRETITVDYGVGIQVNGTPFTPTDANGNEVAPFIYNGTTYVPLRAVSQALSCTVDYNSSTRTVLIASNSATSDNTKKAAISMNIYHNLLRAQNFADIAHSTAFNVLAYTGKVSTASLNEAIDLFAQSVEEYKQSISSIGDLRSSLENSDPYFKKSLEDCFTAETRAAFYYIPMSYLEDDLRKYITSPSAELNDWILGEMQDASDIINEIGVLADTAYNREFLNMLG